MSVKIAVISDLHCQSKDSKNNESFLYYDAEPRPRTKHPVESLIRLIQDSNLVADALVIAGDLTNAMSREGLRGGWGFALRIAEKLGVGMVAATVGNHDVDSRHEYGDDPFQFARYQVGDGFPVRDAAPGASYWDDGFCMVEREDLQILVINSAAEHVNIDQAKQGGITEARIEQIDDFLRDQAKRRFRVALFHHHPMLHEGCGMGAEDVMHNGSLLLPLLESHDFSLVMHGHKHHPRLIYGPGGMNSIAVLAAGSLSANNASNPGLMTITRNLFHIVTLEDRDIEHGDHCGTVQSWEFGMTEGWALPKCQSARIPSMTGFGCRVASRVLAVQAAELLRQRGDRYIGWQDVLSAMPYLAYLIPQDLEAFGNCLKNDFRIKLFPDPPDPPAVVGYPDGGS